MLSFSQRSAWWQALPLLLTSLLLVLGPALVTLRFAFTEYDALSAPRFTGLENFETLWA